MSVVIIGGHDRMVCVSIRKFVNLTNVKAKVFTPDVCRFWTSRLVDPDLCILFTNTVSRTKWYDAVDEAEKKKFKIVVATQAAVNSIEVFFT